MKKLLCFSIIIAIVFTLTIPVFANTETLTTATYKTEPFQEDRLQNVFEEKVSTFGDNIEIDRMIQVTDFAGNLYTVIECMPIGYAIFHNQSGLFVEYSPSSPSPYHDLEGTLYYGGPTEYYLSDNGVIYHTIVDEHYSLEESLDSLYESSVTLNSAYCAKQDSDVLSYVQGNSSFSKRSQLFARVNTQTADTYVDDSNIISNLKTAKECGYYVPSGSNGVCGYIAAGILLLYYDYHYDDAFIDDAEYLNTSGTKFKGAEFTKLLRSLGATDDTTAYSISSPIQRYLNTRGIDITVTDHLIPTTYVICNRIDANQPVIMFGSWLDVSASNTSYVNHAVLAYGYESSRETMIVHYGWADYSEVHLQGVTGSTFNIASYSL